MNTNYQYRVNLLTPIFYASCHFCKKEYKKGALHCIPVLGYILTFKEWCSHNLTVESKLKARQLFILNEIESTSFKIQALYFELSKEPHKLSSFTAYILSNSTPDRQYSLYIRDLKKFIESVNLTDSRISQIGTLISCLEKALPLALLVSLIIESPSKKEKEELLTELYNHVHHQIYSMKPGDKILIPCGYMNGNSYDLKGILADRVGGHSLLLEIEKKETGYDLQFFDTAHTKRKKVYPVSFKNVMRSKRDVLDFIYILTSFAVNEFYNKETTTSSFYEEIKRVCKTVGEKNKQITYPAQKIANCAKECIQFWLYRSMTKKLFTQFHQYLLKGKIKAIQPLLKKPFLLYRHPLLKLGWTSSAFKPFALLQEQISNVLGRQMIFPIWTNEIRNLLEEFNGISKKKA